MKGNNWIGKIELILKNYRKEQKSVSSLILEKENIKKRWPKYTKEVITV